MVSNIFNIKQIRWECVLFVVVYVIVWLCTIRPIIIAVCWHCYGFGPLFMQYMCWMENIIPNLICFFYCANNTGSVIGISDLHNHHFVNAYQPSACDFHRDRNSTIRLSLSVISIILVWWSQLCTGGGDVYVSIEHANAWLGGFVAWFVDRPGCVRLRAPHLAIPLDWLL